MIEASLYVANSHTWLEYHPKFFFVDDVAVCGCCENLIGFSYLLGLLSGFVFPSGYVLVRQTPPHTFLFPPNLESALSVLLYYW